MSWKRCNRAAHHTGSLMTSEIKNVPILCVSSDRECCWYTSMRKRTCLCACPFWAFFDASLFPGAAIQEARLQVTGGEWPPKGIIPFDPWHLPLINTLILLCSGAAATWAHHALVHDNNRKDLQNGLILAIVLGVLFTIFLMSGIKPIFSISSASSMTSISTLPRCTMP